MGKMQGAVPCRLAIDVVGLDPLEDGLRTLSEGCEQPASRRLAHDGDNVLRGQPESGIDEADIATRAAMGNALGLQ